MSAIVYEERSGCLAVRTDSLGVLNGEVRRQLPELEDALVFQFFLPAVVVVTRDGFGRMGRTNQQRPRNGLML